MSPRGDAPKRNVTRKLGAIKRKLAKERQKERTIRADFSAAQAEVRRCEEALAAHFASDDHDPEPVELYAALEAAEAKAAKGRWEPRLEGARRNIAKLESLEATFARDNSGALLAERQSDAIEVAEQVTECARALGDAMGRYGQIGAEVLQIVNADPRTNGKVIVPTLGQEGQQLQRDVRLLAAGVPPPLPKLGEEADPTITSGGTVTDLAEGE